MEFEYFEANVTIFEVLRLRREKVSRTNTRTHSFHMYTYTSSLNDDTFHWIYGKKYSFKCTEV